MELPIIEDVYKDASEMLVQLDSTWPQQPEDFYALVEYFRKSYLHTKRFNERLTRHRTPATVCHEVLQQSYAYLQQIDRREVMQDVATIDGQKVHGYVPTRVIDIWKEDKAFRSLYRAVQQYCEATGKELRVIAIHIAERRALDRVGALIRRKLRLLEAANNTSRPFRHFGDMHLINPERLLKGLQDLHCDPAGLATLSSADFEMKQFDTKPIKAFPLPANFPDCCTYHRRIMALGAERYAEFPDCCEPHRRLKTAPWFKKENYAYLPYKLTTTLLYSANCIQECISHSNWQKEIIDYIEYTKRSYGQFPHGFGSPFGLEYYLYNLQKWVESNDHLPGDKKTILLDYFAKESDQQAEIGTTDINLLIAKYKEWLKIFPFNIPFFASLKPFFESRMPILSDEAVTNMYTGVTAVRMKTKKELIAFLSATTAEILKEINSLKLYKSGQLRQVFEAKKQMIMANRQLELEELTKADWDDKRDYIKLLKKWLSGEKKFLKEISPLLEKELYITSFIESIVAGMRELQEQDSNAECIVKVRTDAADKEAAFRYWYKTFLKGRHPDAVFSAEEEKGKGRIDLKATQLPYGCHVIEFKGWWNSDKINAPAQLCSYLTDFEKQGYVFMINHLKEKGIEEAYKKIVTSTEMNYIEDSWKAYKIENADLWYYESRHKFAIKEKTIFHFLFDVNFANVLDRKQGKKK